MPSKEVCKECGRPIGRKYGGTLVTDLSGRNLGDIDPKLLRQADRYYRRGKKLPKRLIKQISEQSIFWLCDEHMEEYKQRYFTPSQIEQMNAATSDVIIAPIERG